MLSDLSFCPKQVDIVQIYIVEVRGCHRALLFLVFFEALNFGYIKTSSYRLGCNKKACSIYDFIRCTFIKRKYTCMYAFMLIIFPFQLRSALNFSNKQQYINTQHLYSISVYFSHIYATMTIAMKYVCCCFCCCVLSVCARVSE